MALGCVRTMFDAYYIVRWHEEDDGGTPHALARSGTLSRSVHRTMALKLD